MLKTPTGAKRPANVIGNAVHALRIANGDTFLKPNAGSTGIPTDPPDTANAPETPSVLDAICPNSPERVS
jgi:hypothetical protein